MSNLSRKIDFAVIIGVQNSNPNGDPLNGNRPRIDYDGYGEISDVCIKRKIRDRLLENGYPIFVQSDDRKIDSAKCLKERADKVIENWLNSHEVIEIACKTWFDVRAFGQLFAFTANGGNKKNKGNKGNKGDNESESGVSIPIRGPVSVHSAFSVEPVSISSIQITKSVSGEEGKNGKKSSDTMGMKHRVDKGVYVFFGSMNPQLAERTGFSSEDACALKNVLPKLFENDASSARPEGSMTVKKVFWWEHNSKSGQYSSARVHATLIVKPDGEYELNDLEELVPEVIDGF